MRGRRAQQRAGGGGAGLEPGCSGWRAHGAAAAALACMRGCGRGCWPQRLCCGPRVLCEPSAARLPVAAAIAAARAARRDKSLDMVMFSIFFSSF